MQVRSTHPNVTGASENEKKGYGREKWGSHTYCYARCETREGKIRTFAHKNRIDFESGVAQAATMSVLGHGALFLLTMWLCSSRTGAVPEPDHARMPYGHVYVDGAVEPLEYFRASFGSLIPCGSHPLVMVPDSIACAPILSDALEGSFAIAYRGNCSFVTKAMYVQKVGAAGIIIVNTEPGLLRMPMGSNPRGADVDIPAVMVRSRTMDLLRVALSAQHPIRAMLKPAKATCVDTNAETKEEEEDGEASASVELSQGSDLSARGFGSLSEAVPSICEVAELRVGDLPGDGSERTLDERDWSRETPIEAWAAQFGAPLAGDPAPLQQAFPFSACSPLQHPTEPETKNASEWYAGHMVLVQREECPMIDKARFVQAAGGVAAIIVSNDRTAEWLEAVAEQDATRTAIPAHSLGLVQPAPDSNPTDVVIAVALVSRADGKRILRALQPAE